MANLPKPPASEQTLEAPFLQAQWRWLVMLNYETDSNLLEPYLPAGTEIDFFHGKTYVSLVGFLFLDTRVKGIPIPFHRDFEEVNLRFYVRRKAEEGWRRGVVFIKEIVPRRAIAWAARTFYNENYIALPMRHSTAQRELVYSWRIHNDWNYIKARRSGEPALAVPGTQEEFITEHYWGYAAQPSGATVEYRVGHVPWRIWQVEQTAVHLSTSELYGPEFAAPLSEKPASAFVAEGSPVTVYSGRALR
ncbi:MAG: DUF2071 domain-containing protein [Bryobacterales bacterium]